MSLTRRDVCRIARLARLDVPEDELPRLETELGRILDYVDELAAVDTSDADPATRVGPELAPLRADEVREGLTREQALAGAPRATEGAFAVPEFVDES